MTEPQFASPRTRRLRRIAPVSLGKILGVMYALMGLIFLPFFALASLFAVHAPGHDAAPMMGLSLVFALLMPIFYGVAGFIFGVLSAWVYNLLAGWIGGIELEIE